MSATEKLAANHWPDDACARAFWGQRELPPYRRLLKDTVDWLEPKAGERWLDLGCGGGQLTRALWEKSGGTLESVVALDCAAANEQAIAKLRAQVRPRAGDDHLQFLCADFSSGLKQCDADRFNGVVSGLALQYAESQDANGNWTTDAYDGVLADVFRILVPGGRFVFSVNVPNPSWRRVARSSVPGFFISRNPPAYLCNAYRMWRYGRWLKKQARAGRFHYLPIESVKSRLERIGFVRIDYRLSFAKQAYLVQCAKPTPDWKILGRQVA